LQAVIFSKRNSVLQGNNVLDAAASNIDGFLWRYIVSSTQQNRPIWRKQDYLNLETPNLQEVFLSKTN
jgi:hypothetical protein